MLHLQSHWCVSEFEFSGFQLRRDVSVVTGHVGSTKNFSGAEIQGLVKSAISWALNRQINVGDLSKPVDEDNLKVTHPS